MGGPPLTHAGSRSNRRAAAARRARLPPATEAAATTGLTGPEATVEEAPTEEAWAVQGETMSPGEWAVTVGGGGGG